MNLCRLQLPVLVLVILSPAILPPLIPRLLPVVTRRENRKHGLTTPGTTIRDNQTSPATTTTNHLVNRVQVMAISLLPLLPLRFQATAIISPMVTALTRSLQHPQQRQQGKVSRRDEPLLEARLNTDCLGPLLLPVQLHPSTMTIMRTRQRKATCASFAQKSQHCGQ